MFFQETTPDTSGYMIAGYAVAFIVMALYVTSMYLRSRNLKQDMTVLHELEESAPAETSQPKRHPAKPGADNSAKSVTKKHRRK